MPGYEKTINLSLFQHIPHEGRHGGAVGSLSNSSRAPGLMDVELGGFLWVFSNLPKKPQASRRIGV